MSPSLRALLMSQTNHSAVALLAILVLAAKAAGVSPILLSESVLEVIATLGTLAAVAKLALPGQIDVPPGAVVVAPPAAEAVAQAVEAAVEGKGAQAPPTGAP